MVVNSKEIQGMKVYSLEDGDNVAEISGVIFDEGLGRVLGLEAKDDIQDVFTIPLENISSFGQDSVLISSTAAMLISEPANSQTSTEDINFDSETGEVNQEVVSKGYMKDDEGVHQVTYSEIKPSRSKKS
jgi:uncharacterized protein YrrD